MQYNNEDATSWRSETLSKSQRRDGKEANHHIKRIGNKRFSFLFELNTVSDMKKIVEHAVCCANELINNLEREKESKISYEKQVTMNENKLKILLSKESEWHEERSTLNELQKDLRKKLNSSRQMSEELRNKNEQTQKQVLYVNFELNETERNLQYQKGEVDRLRINLAIAESDLVVSKETYEHLKLSEMQQGNEMKVLTDQFADVVTKCRDAFARNEQLEEEKKNLEESVLQINETLSNVQNENMRMQSERDKLLVEKTQDEAVLLEDISMINALTEKLNEKDMLLQRTKASFEELVNGYKYGKQGLIARRPSSVNTSTDVDIWTQFNSSQSLFRETKGSSKLNQLSNKFRISCTEHERKLNNMKDCNWDRFTKALVTAKNKYTMECWKTEKIPESNRSFIVDSLYRAFEEIVGLEKDKDTLLVDKSICEIENKKLNGNVDSLKDRLSQVTFDLNNSVDDKNKMTTIRKTNKKLKMQLTNSENGQLELEKNVQNLHTNINCLQKNSAGWRKKARTYLADNEKLKREMGDRVSQLETEVKYYRCLDIICQKLEQKFLHERQMRIEDVEEYEGMKDELNRFKMLIQKYESKTNHHNEPTSNEEDKQNEKPVINLQTDPTNRKVKDSDKNFQTNIGELKDEVEEMFATNFQQYSACIGNKEDQQSEKFNTNTINNNKLKKLKKNLREEIKVLEEKLCNLQTMVRSSDIHCNMRSIEIEREFMNANQQVKFDELQLKIRDLEENIKFMDNNKTLPIPPIKITLNKGSATKTRHIKMTDLQRKLQKCKVRIDKIESLHDNEISECKQDIVEETIERQLQGDIRAIERKIDEVQTMLSYQNKMQENQRLSGVEETVLNLKLKSAEIQTTLKSYYQCGDQQNKLSRLETTMADLNLKLNKIEQSIALLSDRNQQSIENTNRECNSNTIGSTSKMTSKTSHSHLQMESQEIKEKSEIPNLKHVVEDLQKNMNPLTKQKHKVNEGMKLLQLSRNVHDTTTKIEYDKPQISERQQTVKGVHGKKHSLKKQNEKADENVELVKLTITIRDTATSDAIKNDNPQIPERQQIVKGVHGKKHSLKKQNGKADENVELVKLKTSIRDTATSDAIKNDNPQIPELQQTVKGVHGKKHSLRKQNGKADENVELVKLKTSIRDTATSDAIKNDNPQIPELQQTVKGVHGKKHSLRKQNGKADENVELVKLKTSIRDTATSDAIKNDNPQIPELQQTVKGVHGKKHSLRKQNGKADENVELVKLKTSIRDTATAIKNDKSQISERQQTMKELHPITKKNDEVDEKEKLLRCKKNVPNTSSTDMQEEFSSLRADIKEKNRTLIRIPMMKKEANDKPEYNNQ